MSWQSLSDVYANRVVGRQQLNEAVVSIKFKDTKEDHTFELEDIYARKVLGFAAYTSHFLEKLVTDWLKSGGWSDVAVKRGSEQLQSIFLDTFNMNDPSIVKGIAADIKTIVEFKQVNNQRFYEFIADGGAKNLFDVFIIPGVQYLNSTDFLSKLVQIDFAENKVSVGPGEVAITLFTEATNPTKGDLHVKGIGEIELKGTLGRIGKGDRERYVYNKILNKATDARSIEKIQEEIYFNIINVKQNFPDPGLLLKFKKVYKHSKIFKLIQSIYNSKDLKSFLALTDASSFTKGESEKLILILSQLTPIKEQDENSDFIDSMIQLIESAYKIHAYKVGKETKQFKLFFDQDLVDDEKKLNTLYEYVETKFLSDNVKEIISEAFSSGIEPAQVVGAITVANYQQKEDFKYIIFANTRPGIIASGSLPCKIIGPFTDNYENDLKMLFRNLTDVTFTPNADRGGFQTDFIGQSVPSSIATAPSTLPEDQTAPEDVEADKLNIAI